MPTNWFPATSATAATDLRVGFDTPSGNLNAGADLQTFRIEVRKTAGTLTPTVDVELWEAGSFVATLANDVSITNTTRQILEVTWNASLLSDASGADVELRIVATPGS